jgi:hypothetical protein
VKLIHLLSLSLMLAAFSAAAEQQSLPWQREIPLCQAARSVFLKNTLHPTDPLPDWRCYPMGKAMTINNLKMRTTLWGTPDRVTISLMKNNVWDRRLNPRGLTAPTLQEIVDGALAPANKDFVSVGKDSQRPHGLGYLLRRKRARVAPLELLILNNPKAKPKPTCNTSSA